MQNIESSIDQKDIYKIYLPKSIRNTPSTNKSILIGWRNTRSSIFILTLLQTNPNYQNDLLFSNIKTLLGKINEENLKELEIIQNLKIIGTLNFEESFEENKTFSKINLNIQSDNPYPKIE
jgi:hypothetical protein